MNSIRKRILITGGAGFIGSALVRRLVDEVDAYEILNVDSLTYAGNLSSVASVATAPNYRFVRADICDAAAITQLMAEFRPDIVAHLAAESHVDRSIDGPGQFVQTNVVGTFTMLSAARSYWESLDEDGRSRFRFHHISTDEVFGALGPEGRFTEQTPYDPRSPYSASKAGSDHLARAWHHTYGLPVLVTNCSNNYGPYQFPEKLVPLVIIKGLAGEGLPVYGRGENVRDWLYVDDHVHALQAVFERGVPGESYMVGGDAERRNIDVVTTICDILDRVRPRIGGASHRDQIEFVQDRPGHDFRYSIDSSKLQRELGWKRRESFETGMEKTVSWYIDNREWWQPIRDGSYQGDRLGLKASGS